jgi:hypothetical protein
VSPKPFDCAQGRRVLVIVMMAAWPLVALAQGPPGRGGPPQPPRSAREGAPVDLTGYWVSVVTEDWRWRMVTPLKGDFASIPINPMGRQVGETWDPAKDESAGQQCKGYGAPAIMRLPGRVHITWQGDKTLKLDFDTGTQTRFFRFDTPAAANTQPSWQGYSTANWERPPRGVEAQNAIPVFAVRTGTRGRSLEVKTTKLRAGYLRKNGVPYSDKTEVEEYIDYRKHPNGDEWFTVTTVVRDPVYLHNPFVTSSDFKKEPDGSKFHPTPCEAK